MEAQTFTANILLQGEKDKEEGQKVLEIAASKKLQESLIANNAIFEGLLVQKKGFELSNKIWIDMRMYPEITEDEAKLLIKFIEQYDVRPDKKAEVFATLKEFRQFEVIAQKTKLNEHFHLDTIKEEWFKQHQILILIDVGGSILYREGFKLEISRKVDCQVKKHFHYCRPFHEDYLKSLLDHPRVKLAVYTSIMRKNVMPLLFKLFDAPKLRPHKTKIFEVFDQEYNVPDGGPGKEVWATKRKLEKVFDHPKCQGLDFGFNNTLMIDSEADKIRDYPLNSFQIPPYTLAEVKDPKQDQNKILMTVRDKLYHLLENADNVQDYLEAYKEQIVADILKEQQPIKEEEVPQAKEEEEKKDEGEELAKDLEKKLEIN